MTVDLQHQVSGILPLINGGSGNDFGYGRGTCTPWSYFPAGYASGTTTALAYGSLVRVTTNGYYPTCEQTSSVTERAIGVAVGPVNVNTDAIDLGTDVPAGDVAAIAQSGVVDVLFDGPAFVGQYVIPSATLGKGHAVDQFPKNAIGMCIAFIASAGLAKVLLVNTLGSIDTGCNTQLGVSFFGDTAVAGSVGLAADAGHQHLREPDISSLVTGTPTATASTAKVAHPASDAIDGNGATYWESDGGSTPSIKVDLGAAPGARQIMRSVVVQRGDALNKFTQYTLAYSDDDITYTNVATRTGQSNGVTDTYEFSTVLTHRYWRWTTGTLTGNAQITALDLRAVPYGPIDATTGKIPDAFLNALANPMTTQDDIIVGGAAGAPARLAKGSDGQVLTVDPATHHLVWATPATGLSNPMTTAGDTIYGGTPSAGVAPATRLGIGSTGDVLTVAAGLPSWAPPASGGLNLPTLVQAKINGTGAITSLTLPAAGTSGNVLVFGIVGFNSGNISSLACTNVTWTFIARITTSGGAHVELYVGKISGAGGTSITWTNPNSFTTAVCIEISGATVGSTPTAGLTATGQLFTDLLGIAATTSGHLICAISAVDNTTANNWANPEPTVPAVGVRNGRVSILVGYSLGKPVYVQSQSNVAAAGGVVLGEVT